MAHNHAELLNHIKADMPADELLQDLGDLFKVFNCPSLYTQCKNIKGTWEGLK